MKRRFLAGLLSIFIAAGWSATARAGDDSPPDETKSTTSSGDTATETYLKLGTEEGALGGSDQQAYERGDIKSQILTFIPPLLTPAFVQHAFVLPPGVMQLSVTERFLRIEGDDIFKNGEPNRIVDRDRRIDRQFTDFDLFYGFDLNREYLHAFTLAINVPYISSSVHGSAHPPENPMVTISSPASYQDIGDITIAIKKRIIDQGNFPFGVAMVGGIILPTGKNDEKFGNDGVVDILLPMPGMPPMRAVFNRFTDDGRLPAPMQPGTGGVGFLAGLFLTRQFNPGDFPGRSAFHIGAAHQFVSKHDGVDLGDTTTVFASYVRPVYRDFVAVDLTFVGFYKEHDHYDGQRVFAKLPLGSVMTPREDFSGGFTGFFAPSVIVSPNPQIRFTGSFLIRTVVPDLGPAPDWVARIGLSVTF